MVTRAEVAILVICAGVAILVINSEVAIMIIWAGVAILVIRGEVAIMVIEFESAAVARCYLHFVELVRSKPIKAKLSPSMENKFITLH
jgi:hypothetical protein